MRNIRGQRVEGHPRESGDQIPAFAGMTGENAGMTNPSVILSGAKDLTSLRFFGFRPQNDKSVAPQNDKSVAPQNDKGVQEFRGHFVIARARSCPM